MNNKKSSGSEHVSYKLQKTVSNLISNVISSLCQQFIRYEHSIDIFGLLTINIDDDIDISVKLNEKFIKKDVLNNNTSFDCSKLIETMKKNGESSNNNINNNNAEENICQKNIINNIEKIGTLLNNEEIDKDSSLQKRRPRKAQQTFRHITDIEAEREIVPPETVISVTDDEPEKLLIDMQYKAESINNDKESINKSAIDRESINKSAIDRESITKSIDTDEFDDKPKRVRIDEPLIDYVIPDSPIDINSSESNITFKCNLCDRQFKRKFCLTRHKRVHQGFKSYNCNICGLGFDLINQLKRHMRNMHLYNRDNLRRSCRTNQKIERKPNNNNNNNNINNNNNHHCEMLSTLDYSWSTLNAPITSSLDSKLLQSKSATFSPFSYPPGLVISQSGKKPISNTFQNSFPTSSSLQNHYPIRQLYNSIIPGSETSFPYNNSMYFVQNYPPILPASSQGLYSSAMSHNKVPTTATAHISGISSSALQRLPIYRFSQAMLNSPSLKSLPLTNRNWSSSAPGGEFLPVDKSLNPKNQQS